MRSPEQTTIGEHAYRVAPMPAGKGLAMLTLMARVIGPAFQNVETLAAIGGAEGQLIADVCARLEEDQVARLHAAFAEHTLVEKSPGKADFVPLAGVFDLHFAGDYEALFDWLRFAFRVNFGPFVSALKRRAAEASAAAAAPAASGPRASP